MANVRAAKSDARRKGAGLGRFIESRQRSLLGLPEIIALSAAALLLFAALASYFLLLRPQRARLADLTDEQGRLERALHGARNEGAQSETTQASVEKILASLQEFEARHLGQVTPMSTTEVAGELNKLILRHNLRISGGLDFTQFEGRRADGGQPSRTTTGTSRPVQTVYPGVGIQVSVEGPYANLRRFIRDVESQDDRFIVINSIELEGVTDSASRSALPDMTGEGAAAPVAPSPSRGALVSLRLDMAAYFRRASVDAQANETVSPAATR